MVIAAECSLESKFALMSSHVLRRAVVHECPFRKPRWVPLKRQLRKKQWCHQGYPRRPRGSQSGREKRRANNSLATWYTISECIL